MAAVFCDSFSRAAILCLILVIFTLVSVRSPRKEESPASADLLFFSSFGAVVGSGLEDSDFAGFAGSVSFFASTGLVSSFAGEEVAEDGAVEPAAGAEEGCRAKK